MKEKRKKKVRLDLKMVIPGDQPDNPVDQDLFSLEKLRKKVSGYIIYITKQFLFWFHFRNCKKSKRKLQQSTI